MQKAFRQRQKRQENMPCRMSGGIYWIAERLLCGVRGGRTQQEKGQRLCDVRMRRKKGQRLCDGRMRRISEQRLCDGRMMRKHRKCFRKFWRKLPLDMDDPGKRKASCIPLKREYCGREYTAVPVRKAAGYQKRQV